MLHGHIETLLDEGVVRVYVGTGANDSLSALRLVYAGHSLRTETPLTRVEDHSVLHWLVPLLVHRAGTLRLRCCLFVVETGSWYLQLQGLPVKDLVVIEPGRGRIEPDSLTGNRLVVTRPSPIISPDILLLDASDLVFDAEDGRFVIDMLSLLTLCHNLIPPSSLALQNAHAWVIGNEGHIEAISGRSEDGVDFALFHGQGRLHAAH